MSYAIIRHEMYKNNRNILVNLYKHNARLKNSYSNKNIDIEKSKDNFFIKQATQTFYKSVNDTIENKDIESHIQKASNVLCEFMITSDNDFFNEMTLDEQKQFFTDAYDFVANKIGEQNILNATIHFDEDTPHMHIDYLPIVEIEGKKKLSARTIWKGKNTYHQLQENYYNYIVRDKGHDLERGEVGSVAKHLTVSELKTATNYEENSKKEREINQKYLNRELKPSKDIVSRKEELIENKEFMKKGTYNKQDVDKVIDKYADEVRELFVQSDTKDKIISDLTKGYKGIAEDMVIEKAESLEKITKELERENKYLRAVTNILMKAFKNIKELLLHIPIIKKLTNSKVKLDMEQEIITDYIKSEDILELEQVNLKYYEQMKNDNEIEYEMGD